MRSHRIFVREWSNQIVFLAIREWSIKFHLGADHYRPDQSGGWPVRGPTRPGWTSLGAGQSGGQPGQGGPVWGLPSPRANQSRVDQYGGWPFRGPTSPGWTSMGAAQSGGQPVQGGPVWGLASPGANQARVDQSGGWPVRGPTSRGWTSLGASLPGVDLCTQRLAHNSFSVGASDTLVK